MALNQPRRWLIAYDIRDQRRLARVHRFLTREAVPVQYSVFVAWGSLADMRRLADELQGRIDERFDDVRIYPIPEIPLVHMIGKTALPEDVWLLGPLDELSGPAARAIAPACRSEAASTRASTAAKAESAASAIASTRADATFWSGQRESQP